MLKRWKCFTCEDEEKKKESEKKAYKTSMFTQFIVEEISVWEGCKKRCPSSASNFYLFSITHHMDKTIIGENF